MPPLPSTTRCCGRLLRAALTLLLIGELADPACADGLVPHGRVGVALPQAQLGQGADLAGPLQANLVASLQAAGVDAVALSAGDPSQAAAEAGAKQCAYVLQASAERKGASGIGGFLKKLAPVAGALPVLGALQGGSGGGGLASAAAQLAAQQAANSAAAAAQQQAMQQMTGAQPSNVKSGDTLTLKYRLLPQGGGEAVRSDSLDAKAQADGEDVIGPLVQRLAGSVAAAGIGQPPAGAAAGMGSAAGTPPGFECARMAAMPHAPMSMDACQKMAAAQQAYTSSASDPGANRAGDEQMSCEQIMAELKQQSYSRPDPAKVKEGQAAAADMHQTAMRQQAEATAIGLRQSAAVSAAAAADRATEAASMGMVQGHAAAATAEAFAAQNRVTGERMAAESAPKFHRSMDATANISSDMSAQLETNPRMARLIQLAQSKRCRG